MIKGQDKAYLRRYGFYLKQHKMLLLLAFMLIPLLAAVHLVQPFLLKWGIDHYILRHDFQGLYGVTALFGLAVALEFILRACQSYVFQYIGQKTITAMRSDLFAHMLGLASHVFDKTPLGQMATRLTSDMESLNESFSSGMITLLSDLVIVCGIIVAMLLLNFKMALVVLVFVPFIVIGVNYFRIKMRICFNHMRTVLGQMNAMLQEQLQGVSVVQMFRREQRNDREFKRLNKEYRRTVIASVSYDAILYSFIEALSSVVIAALLWRALGLSAQGAMSFGVLVAFIDYVNKMFTPLKDLSSKFTVLQHALAALEKICGAFEVSDKISSGAQPLSHVRGEIVFKNVSFSYRSNLDNGQADKPILKNISFVMKPGQVVALVGPTGSGKTTVGRLISRLYTGYSGEIMLDGRELSEWSLADVRKNIAVVLQDAYVLSRSVAFNITLGNPAIDHERMLWAARLAQVDAFVRHLPQGYDTILDNRGKNISQGQAQLISFARALASDAPIVLLDEATSSVDSLSEQLIQNGVDELLKAKTALVIAHRLSTIQKADLILALKDGAIIESGKHEDLLRADGFYAKLFKMQFTHL